MDVAHDMPGTPATIEVDAEGVRCAGMWTLEGIQGLERRLAGLRWPETDPLSVDGAGIEVLDTTGALLLLNALAGLEKGGRRVELVDLDPDQQALLDLVRERRAAAGERTAPERPLGFLANIGRVALGHWDQAVGFLAFFGEASVALLRALLNPRRIRFRSLLANIEDAGVNAIPIVGLLAFLMGIVVAYQGGEQLKLYGASIFIVELVSLTMVRELAPLIAAIIVAGRTGSAYTAQIGTMRVTEEVDALRTIGIAPMELLVLPKLFGLLVALPLLTLLADILSVAGGMVMAVVVLDVTATEFLDRVPRVLSVTSLFIGLVKAPIFAIIIALVGCYQGFQVSGGADSVGRQTTVSVVQSIFLVIIVDAILVVNFGAYGL